MKRKLIFVLASLFLCQSAYAYDGEVELMDATGQTASTTGSTFDLKHNKESATVYLVASNNSGTTPTLDAIVQYSFDGTTWFTFAEFAQVTTTDSDQALHLPSMTTNFARFYRAKTTLGGTSPNYDVRVLLTYDRKR